MSVPRPAATGPIRTGRRNLLILLTALSTLGLLATNLYLPSLPALAADLGVGAAEVRLTLTLFLAGLAVSQLVIGPLSDRLGRRPVLLAGLLLYVAASLACLLAANLEALLVWRVLQAIGACTGVVLVRAIARDLFEGAELTRAMAVIATLMATAPGFSPLVGGAIETLWGWRGNFLFVAVFGAACALLVWRWIGETNRRRIAAAGAAPAATGTAGGSYGRLLADARFMGPALLTACALGALFAYFSASPLLIIEILGFTPLGFGLLTAGTVFAVFAGGALGPRLARRLSVPATMIAGICLMIAGGAAMALLFDAGHVTLAGFLAPQILFLIGLGIVNPVGTAAALQPFPQVAGAASALLGFLQMAAATAGTLLLTAMPVPMPLSLPLTTAALALLGLLALAACRVAGRAAAPAAMPSAERCPPGRIPKENDHDPSTRCQDRAGLVHASEAPRPAGRGSAAAVRCPARDRAAGGRGDRRLALGQRPRRPARAWLGGPCRAVPPPGAGAAGARPPGGGAGHAGAWRLDRPPHQRDRLRPHCGRAGPPPGQPGRRRPAGGGLPRPFRRLRRRAPCLRQGPAGAAQHPCRRAAVLPPGGGALRPRGAAAAG